MLVNTAAPAMVLARGSGLAAQRAYIKQIQQDDFDFGLLVGEAFIRGIRDLGYRHPGTALDEFVDNALQAGAQNIHVVFEPGPTDDALAAIGVVDDGHGMDPTMVRLAAIWGGTHRENDRSGFGRYGYGLPSAAVSLGRRFTVYGCPADQPGGTFWATTVDIDEISAGRYTVANSRVVIPEARSVVLPTWIVAPLDEHPTARPVAHGAAVVIEKLDRVKWKTRAALQRHLLEHFGVTYRNFLPRVNLYVDGERVQPIDPLFLTPGMLFYALDDDRAAPLEPIEIAAPECPSEAPGGMIRVRFSYLPATFGSIDKRRKAEGRNGNQRYRIMKDHLGIIVLRLGRQIDVVGRCPWTTFVNYDRYWNVEVDFPASLDEEFSITTSKQRIELSERIWRVLEEAGVSKAIEQMRRLAKEERAQLSSQDMLVEGQRPAAQALEESRRLISARRGREADAQERERQDRLAVEVRRRALETGRPLAEIERELLADIQAQPYKVELESRPGQAFFRLDLLGAQTILYLNSRHRFFTRLYSAADSTRRLQAALEILLFTLGESVAEAPKGFDDALRAEWSAQLEVALAFLDQDITLQEINEPEKVDEDTLETGAD
jgi:hypothetical protein